MVRFEPVDDAGREPAPVVYLHGAAPGMKRRSPLEGRSLPPRADDERERHSDPVFQADPAGHADQAEPVDPAEQLAQAEKLLLTRLRRRSLSVAEARTLVEETDLDADAADDLTARFRDLGYLDDARLAEQVVHSHLERKGLGRSGVEAEMRRRRIPPEVILQALEEAPDDEEARAIEAACKRAAQLTRFDDETIERRLTGFLMRKGYGSAVVRVAVKQALASVPRPSARTTSVRFR
ncbi:regulatory protein RecX [Cryobacterium tepidiphilum]|jgi:regulatory protein|uniref:Regulatory protein RecX n=1 Tax=Cryobacterium tepidiphilum TaxID=2486026 RepID=A0A3M8LCW2_9MICO|nr:regulatory protein RecX [Cryobacterium tepidiphilum]RNE62504.1 RecX family transcriptional regulator [Cryobacterium tepidiphilum]